MSSLFKPLLVRGLTLANRIAVSPMAQYKGADGAATPWHEQHWGSLAVSGPGLVIIESTSVEREGWGSSMCLALHSDEHERSIDEKLRNIRTYSDTPFGIQYGHSGRKASCYSPSLGGKPIPEQNGAWTTWAPSALSFGGEFPAPAELDGEGLARVRRAYEQAAERTSRLDIASIELHGAHGYLLHTFLSPLSNVRDDEYGGSTARRARFIAEIVGSVRARLRPDQVLGIRLNAHDFTDGGMTFADTLETIGVLKDAGIDYVCISAGAISSDTRIAASPGYLVEYASEARRSSGITTFVTGMILSATQADEIIADGHADMVAIARGFLDDTRWVWHAAHDLGVEYPFQEQFLQVRPQRWAGAKLRRPLEAAE